MLNKICLIGRLTKDPELRKSASGKSLLTMRLASDCGSRGKDGEKKVLYIDCSCFERTAEIVATHCRKGTLVAVSGRLEPVEYTDRNGNEVRSFRVSCEGVDFLAMPSTQQAEPPHAKAAVPLDPDDLPF